MSYMLDGIKVIDVGSFVAAPAAGTIMADYGAEVIKVEPPGGDGYRRLHGRQSNDYNWYLTSRNKRDICLDLTQSEGRMALHRLIDDADVLILNFTAEQIQKFELDFEALSKRNRRLIYAHLTGFGTVGSDKDRRGYDSTAWWARSGILDLCKPFAGTPTFPAGGVGDHASAMTLFAGIMMALFQREKTGEGKYVSTSLLANGCWSNGMHLQGVIAGYDFGAVLDKVGYSTPFSSVYKTKDDRFIILVLLNAGKEWPLAAKCLGHSEWLDDARFTNISGVLKHRELVQSMFAEVIRTKTANELCIAFDSEKLTYSIVSRISEVVRDPHLIENEVIIPTGSDDPDYQWTVANPIVIKGESKKPPTAPPVLGEHTRQILSEAGYADGDIEIMLQQGAAKENASTG